MTDAKKSSENPMRNKRSLFPVNPNVSIFFESCSEESVSFDGRIEKAVVEGVRCFKASFSFLQQKK